MFCVRLWTGGSRERGRGEGKPSPGHVPTRLDPTRGSTDIAAEAIEIATGPVSTCLYMATSCCSAVVLKRSKCECMRGGFKERTVTLQIWPEEML